MNNFDVEDYYDDDEEDELQNEFNKTIQSMEYVVDYDGEFILNTVLDNYKELIQKNPRKKNKVHKFLSINEKIRDITKEQIKIIEYCKSHQKITEKNVNKILEMNIEKENLIKEALSIFPQKK